MRPGAFVMLLGVLLFLPSKSMAQDVRFADVVTTGEVAETVQQWSEATASYLARLSNSDPVKVTVTDAGIGRLVRDLGRPVPSALGELDDQLANAIAIGVRVGVVTVLEWSFVTKVTAENDGYDLFLKNLLERNITDIELDENDIENGIRAAGCNVIPCDPERCDPDTCSENLVRRMLPPAQ